MATRRSYVWPIVTSIIAVLVLIIAMPQSAKQWTPWFLREPSLHFGLDLAGGTQLDFRISEREMEDQITRLEDELTTLEATGATQDILNSKRIQLQSIREQQRDIVEAIRTVLERRINALGVSEAVITPSYFGNEKHLLVECPGVVNVQECIDTVGKTIALEFKEEFTEGDEDHEATVRANVENVLARITESGDTLHVVGQDMSDELGVAYVDTRPYFRDELPEGLDDLWNKRPGTGVIRKEGSVESPTQAQDGSTEIHEIPGIFLSEVVRERTQTGRLVNEAPVAFNILDKREQGVTYNSYEEKTLDASIPGPVSADLSTMKAGELKVTPVVDGDAHILFLRNRIPGGETMAASHILVSFAGAAQAGTDVTRTKEEAHAKALDLKKQLDGGADFETIAREHSDGPSGKEGGSLGTFGRGTMVPQFELVSFALQAGGISDPVETQFGYHIIRADEAASINPPTVKYDELVVSGEDSVTRANMLLAQLQKGEVTTEEDVIFVRSIFFSLLPTGWKDTTLDGKHFQSATVTLDPTTNLPTVQIIFDDEGGKLFGELTKRNVQKRIAIFVGGQLVSAPVVQQEITGGTAIITGSSNFDEAKQLATDLNTGAIPAPIYLSGQRTVEATLGATALQTSLKAALIGIIILMVYMVLVYRALGLLANVALSMYAILFFAILKLPLFLFTSQYIVLTLAGMAGIILSIGMAVDANVLIFERMKEELRKGKMLITATETGFKRAWPSIRDGNVSTFITCAILFIIGTSIVRGFAVTLGMGILISMFSAIVITRWLVRRVARTPLGERTELFGGYKQQDEELKE